MAGRYAKKAKRGALLLLILCLVFAALIAFFVWKSSRTKTYTPSKTQADNLPSVMPPQKDPYEAVLERYRRALTEGWTGEQCDIEGISGWFAQEDGTGAAAGYLFLDMNGDGRQELLVGSGERIWDIYTLLEDGTPISILIDEQNGCQYFLCEDGILCAKFVEQENGFVEFFSMDALGLWQEAALVYRDGTWSQDGKTISSSAADAVISSYRRLTPEWQYFVSNSETHEKEDSTQSHYAPILETYKTALLETWDMGKCADQQISLMAAYYADRPEELLSCLMDLDANGTPELIITDDMMIFDLYTLEGETPVSVLTGWERNAYRLCQDNIIYNHASNSAFNSCYNYYRLENGSLRLVDSIIFDASSDPENPWFLSSDGETPMKPIAETEAKERMERYTPQTISGTSILKHQ